MHFFPVSWVNTHCYCLIFKLILLWSLFIRILMISIVMLHITLMFAFICIWLFCWHCKHWSSGANLTSDFNTMNPSIFLCIISLVSFLFPLWLPLIRFYSTCPRAYILLCNSFYLFMPACYAYVVQFFNLCILLVEQFVFCSFALISNVLFNIIYSAPFLDITWCLSLLDWKFYLRSISFFLVSFPLGSILLLPSLRLHLRCSTWNSQSLTKFHNFS